MGSNETQLANLLDQCALRHGRLCPRQVLGVRMGLAGADLLGLEIPRADKQLLIILETDGCFATGVEVATGCTVGHRTLRVEDIGKVAATFIHAKSERAIRLAPRPDVRGRSLEYACQPKPRYFAQLEGYARMPADELFLHQEVALIVPAKEFIGRPGVRATCEHCGEEIINGREIHQGVLVLCRSCAGGAYYHGNPFDAIDSAGARKLPIRICA